MTASHLPYTRNGLKFFTKRGGLTSSEVEEICEKAGGKYANRQAKVSTALKVRPKTVDLMSAYSNHLEISSSKESIILPIMIPLFKDFRFSQCLSPSLKP
ncbi:hypothetical protein SASPL_133136 [Salvia splendens]|uniref:Phosphomannomutase n=1 Tax=Salvia splendens TaxID=180675 RepID=A0A8X8X257_SALSN|nr:hypothetical protein SASPL_133136 [Salvia splendens]